MTLDEIRQLIIDSDRERDWHDIALGSYFKDVPEVDENTFEWHDSMIVYRHDVDLSIQWGMAARGNRHIVRADQIWREHGNFTDESVTVEFADVFWRGNLVDRVRIVSVDGGRATLPVGDQRRVGTWVYWATGWEVAVARLLDTSRDFDRYFSQTSMTVLD